MDRDEITGITTYDVTWFSFETVPNKYVNYGVCEKTGKIAFFNIPTGTIDDLAPMVIRDVCTGFGTCDDGKSCLDSTCEFCKTTQEEALSKKYQRFWEEFSEPMKKEIGCKSLDDLIPHFIRRIKQAQEIVDSREYEKGHIIIYNLKEE